METITIRLVVAFLFLFLYLCHKFNIKNKFKT